MINCYNVLKELDFEHLAASPEEAKAREIIKKYLDESNINYQEEAFTMHGFETGNSQILAGDLQIDALPFGLIESQEIQGQLVILDNIKVAEYNYGAFKDKIIMSYGVSRNAFDLMLKQGVKAFISVSGPRKEASNLSHRQENVTSGLLPSVSIRYEDAIKLIPHNGSDIHIKIDQKRFERKAYNIVASIGQANIDQNITYLTAHYDTVARSHGSSDNGAGTVVILKVAQYFAEKNPDRQLKVIFCSGEEMGLLGSTAYVEKHIDEIKENGSFVVNVDVAGDYFGSDRMMVIGTNELKGYMSGISKEAGYCFDDILNIYSSDAMPFSVYEIPSVNLARFGGSASSKIHTINDDMTDIYDKNLDFYFNATVNILERVLTSKIWNIPKEIDPSLRSKIEKYMWGSRRKEPKLEWKPNYKK
jgi:Zn-dependent M28 family amino/carboxypeptidase